MQLRRAARSVAANVAEGRQREHLGDFVRHVSFARGSLAEVETDLILIRKICPGSEEDVAKCLTLAGEVGRMLTRLAQSLRRRRVGQ
jgi:four helix bundle protein